jgi:hypothetical protein
MNRRNNVVIGIIFVALGGLFMLKNFQIFDFNNIILKFWPSIILILPSLAIHSVFFSGKNKDAGILVPAGILLTVGVILQVSVLFGFWGRTWPGYILAVAVGLFELYLFGNREKGLLIPVGILGGISFIFFTQITLKDLYDLRMRQFAIPVALILLGILIIFRNLRRKNDAQQ